MRIKAFFGSRTFLSFATIVFALKGLGGSFNSCFVAVGIPEYHGPFVGTILAILIIACCYSFIFSPETAMAGSDYPRKSKIIFFVLFALLLTAGIFVRHKKIQSTPIDEGRADMLVTITSQISDYTQGKDPYLPYVTGQGRTLQRFYLPVLWLSYTPFYLMGVDIRYLNILSQLAVLILIFSCFLRKQNYLGLSSRTSAFVFLATMGLFCFSKQKIADVIDVQTAAFWLFYSLVLWGEMLRRHRVVLVSLPIVLVCRHPAILLFIPYFFWMCLREQKRFWTQVLACLILCPILIFPFMQNPYNIIESILFYAGGIKESPLAVTSMFYGLSSILQRSHLTILQKPFQISGLLAGLFTVIKRSELDAVQSLALGGIAYTTFIAFVSSTPQYVWAELIFLIYFLMNRPTPVRIKSNA